MDDEECDEEWETEDDFYPEDARTAKDREERCDECMLVGDWQCSIHGDDTIELQRYLRDGHDAAMALQTLRRLLPEADLFELQRACMARYPESAVLLEPPV